MKPDKKANHEQNSQRLRMEINKLVHGNQSMKAKFEELK